MAVDKAVDSTVLDGYFEDIADSIRAKAGTQSTYTPAQMSAAIDDIPSSDLSEYFYDTGSSWKELVKKIPGSITVNGTNISYFFENYNGTTTPTINGSITTNATRMEYLFEGCKNLTSVDLSNFNMNSSADMNNMFKSCQSITNIIFGNMKSSSMGGMFSGCTSLNEIDLSKLDTSNVTTFQNMFSSCMKLEKITFGNNFNTSNGTNFQNMFQYAFFSSSTKTLDISMFDFGKATKIVNIFYGSSYIENLSFGYDLGKGYLTTASANFGDYTLNLSEHTKLTHDSLMSVINGLYDIASAGVQPQQLILGSTNLAKLTAAEIAIATNKGWTVS